MISSDLMELMANEKIREMQASAAARQAARPFPGRSGWRYARAMRILRLPR